MKKDTQEAAFRQRVLEYQKKDHTVTETAIRYHLSRKTVHKWRNRWDGTPNSLMDHSRRPKNSPRKQTEEEIRLVRRQAKKYKWRIPGSQGTRIYTLLWLLYKDGAQITGTKSQEGQEKA